MHGICKTNTDNSTNTYGNVADEALKSDWRTPTSAEWEYNIKTRASGSTVGTTSDTRYAHATINTDNGTDGVNSVILFPDGVTIAADETTSWGNINSTWDGATKCTSALWTALAAKGCVPACCRLSERVVGLRGRRERLLLVVVAQNVGCELYFLFIHLK